MAPEISLALIAAASALLTALIAAFTSVVAAIFTTILATYIKDQRDKSRLESAEAAQLNLEYFNPLRLFLEESYFRLREIHVAARTVQQSLASERGRRRLNQLLTLQSAKQIEEMSDSDQALLTAWNRCAVLRHCTRPPDVSSKSVEWFSGEGAYLISSAYLVAGLFFLLRKLKEDRPYIPLARKQSEYQDDDTILINLVNDVSRAFLRSHGVYFLVQPAIGYEMFLPEQDRLVTYKEYAEILRDPETRVWFDRLLTYFQDAAGDRYFDHLVSEDATEPLPPEVEHGRRRFEERLRSLTQAVDAIGLISIFLDEEVGGGPSIHKRLLSETAESHDSFDIMSMPELHIELRNNLREQREKLQRAAQRTMS